ncbi:hypothetical protein [Kitasatospora sp. NPDC088134]|uniref:hypothetical protein n=1 Tax=Kitasatospora sp. NPDC088134 TaxID=3364071 RepID=UPI00382FDD44
MFNRIEVEVLPRGTRRGPTLRVLIDGEDLAARVVGPGGRGPFAAELADGGPLWGSPAGRRLVLGEPECTGGCCGWISVLVRRHPALVEWTDWELPLLGERLPDLHFEAGPYDAELARAAAPR